MLYNLYIKQLFINSYTIVNDNVFIEKLKIKGVNDDNSNVVIVVSSSRSSSSTSSSSIVAVEDVVVVVLVVVIIWYFPFVLKLHFFDRINYICNFS